jgi:hypothetical protein
MSVCDINASFLKYLKYIKIKIASSNPKHLKQTRCEETKSISHKQIIMPSHWFYNYTS